MKTFSQHAATGTAASACVPALRRKHAGAPGATPEPLCEECMRHPVRRKLAVGTSDDPLERDADAMADRVMSSERAGSIGAAPLQVRRDGDAGQSAGAAPDSVEQTLAEGGQALEPALRQDMAQRFGRDFFDVRIHADARAAESARDVHARAYTVGRHIVFGAGRYAPATRAGRRLIAHELAHVVQQGESGRTVRRQGDDPLDELGLGDIKGVGDLAKDLAKAAEEEVRKQLRAVGALPGTGAVFSKSGCPSNFCNPYKDVALAKKNLLLTAPFLLAGVAKVVSPRVVPLWTDYLLGGSPLRDISSSFAGDFTASATTASTAAFIVTQMKKEIAANHKALMGPAASVNVDLTGRMPKTLAAIDNAKASGGCPPANGAMDFCTIGEIPGNIAGGIGKDQKSKQIGAQPSPVDDRREATITAQLTRAPGEIKVKPGIDFVVTDTIDLCPGNCGAVTEQDATIPMSRFEATKLSGDVPFTVKFPAPASALGAFSVPLPKAKPAPGKGKSPKKGKSKPGGKGAFLAPAQPSEEAVAAQAAGSEADGDEELVEVAEGGMGGEPDFLV